MNSRQVNAICCVVRHLLLTAIECCCVTHLQFVCLDVAASVGVELAPDAHELDARLERVVAPEEQQEVLVGGKHLRKLQARKFERN